MGANAALPVGSAPSRAPERQKGSGPRSLQKVAGTGGVGPGGCPGPSLGLGHLWGRLFPPGGSRGSGSKGPWVERCPGRGAPCLRGPLRCPGAGWGPPSPPGPVQGRGGWEGGQHGLITETLFPQLSETCPGALQLGHPWVGCCPFPTRGVLGQVHLSPGLAEVVPGPCPRPPGIPGARFKALLPSQLFCDVLSVFWRKKKKMAFACCVVERVFSPPALPPPCPSLGLFVLIILNPRDTLVLCSPFFSVLVGFVHLCVVCLCLCINPRIKVPLDFSIPVWDIKKKKKNWIPNQCPEREEPTWLDPGFVARSTGSPGGGIWWRWGWSVAWWVGLRG